MNGDATGRIRRGELNRRAHKLCLRVPAALSLLTELVGAGRQRRRASGGIAMSSACLSRRCGSAGCSAKQFACSTEERALSDHLGDLFVGRINDQQPSLHDCEIIRLERRASPAAFLVTA